MASSFPLTCKHTEGKEFFSFLHSKYLSHTNDRFIIKKSLLVENICHTIYNDIPLHQVLTKRLFNMKKKLLTIVSALAIATTAMADDYPYLTFKKSDGTLVSVKSNSLMMSIKNGKLSVYGASDHIELTVADLASMYFSTTDETTGIEDIPAADTKGKLEAFSTLGVSYGTFEDIEALKKALPEGIYIIKSNGKTYKTAVR